MLIIKLQLDWKESYKELFNTVALKKILFQCAIFDVL